MKLPFSFIFIFDCLCKIKDQLQMAGRKRNVKNVNMKMDWYIFMSSNIELEINTYVTSYESGEMNIIYFKE